jgi:hypothetical protein
MAVVYPWFGEDKRMPVAFGTLFLACFFLLVIYHFHPHFPRFGHIYLNVLTVIAFIWCCLRIFLNPQDRSLLPAGFELLLIAVAWFIPIVLGSVIELSKYARENLFLVCVQAVPFLAMLKMSIGRKEESNWKVALSFCLILSLVALVGLFHVYMQVHPPS